ncbi:YaaA family protein [Bifidobacterium aquikefiri]|uniref:YaaA family protein n=1 Tax=Bifidobacterium aquikefiri TaxID=1653207 RepID=UPI0039E7AB05
MHILLPPSEGKSFPETGPVMELQKLSFPELADARHRVLEALIEVSNRDDAAEILKVGKRVIPEVVAQRDILNMPCAPARKVYNGVLYQAAQLRNSDDVLIFSALFGITSADDLIPAYRLSMNASLPGIGSLKSFWRRELAKVASISTGSDRKRHVCATSDTDETLNTTVDMRSGAYQVTTTLGQSWDLRVVDSRDKVITHAAKHYRGLLTRALLDAQQTAQPERRDTPAGTGDITASLDVAQVARTLGHIEVTHDGLHHHITLKLGEG